MERKIKYDCGCEVGVSEHTGTWVVRNLCPNHKAKELAEWQKHKKEIASINRVDRRRRTVKQEAK